MENGNDFFEKNKPSKTWIGIGFFVSILLSSFVGTYSAISPDIREYYKNKKEIDLARIQAQLEKDKELFDVRTECAKQRIEQLNEIISLKNMVTSLKAGKCK